MNLDNIRVAEIHAFLTLIPEEQRKDIIAQLMEAKENDDMEEQMGILLMLWEQVVIAHIEAAHEGRFEEIILNMANPFESVN